jgi:hypothetical protein
MAAKKSSSGKKASAPKKASAKKGGGKKKAATKKAGKTSKSSKSSATKKSAPKGAGKKASASAVKLTSRQSDFLRKIKDAGEPGYRLGQKAEQRTIDSLVDKKLLKKGPKDKTSGHVHYTLSKTGEKIITSSVAPPPPM